MPSAFIQNPVRARDELGMTLTKTPAENLQDVLKKQQPRKSSRRPRSSRKIKKVQT